MSNFTSGCWVQYCESGKMGVGGGGSYVTFPTSLGGGYFLEPHVTVMLKTCDKTIY